MMVDLQQLCYCMFKLLKYTGLDTNMVSSGLDTPPDELEGLATSIDQSKLL